MPSREQKSINAKTGVVIVLVVAICISLIYTVIATVQVLQQNKRVTTGGAQAGGTGADTGITVKVGLFDVKMSFPGSVAEVMYPEQTAQGYVQSLQTQEGVKKAELNSIGMVNLTVTRDYYQNMLTEMHQSLQNMLNGYAQSGDYFSFKELGVNADMTQFTIKVSRSAFENSTDSSVSQAIGARALYYRSFCRDKAPQIQVIFLDYETGETIRSDVYPSA